MNTQKLVKMAGIGILVLLAVFGLVGLFGAKSPVGGSFNSVVVDFAEGISVDGSTIISGAGALTPVSVTSSGAISGTTITSSDLATFASSLIGSATAGLRYFEETESVTAINVLTVSEAGKTFYLNTTGASTTLPAVASSNGVSFKFVVGSALTGDATINSAEGDNIEGSLIVAGAVVDCDAGDTLTFVADGENLGDFVEVRSNGSKWYVTQSNVLTTAKLTCSG